ncbi:MAG: hypothetical protein M3327_00675, partial [Actinomycetota bacterium]|nr:hypothetical protein [Actinomycetota bacterium]
MRTLDEEIDGLYALPLDEFVAARNELARTVRAEGDRAGADRVKALRKPTVSTWAANQVARRDRDGMRALLQAGERLREAHADLVAGGSPRELRSATEAEREAVAKLVAGAREILADAGQTATEATLERVAKTLHAAALDDEARELLERGRLERDLDATGFGPLPASLPPRRRAAPGPSPRPE